MTTPASDDVGDTIVDLRTGETLTILEPSERSGGERVVMRLTLAREPSSLPMPTRSRSVSSGSRARSS